MVHEPPCPNLVVHLRVRVRDLGPREVNTEDFLDSILAEAAVEAALRTQPSRR